MVMPLTACALASAIASGYGYSLKNFIKVVPTEYQCWSGASTSTPEAKLL